MNLHEKPMKQVYAETLLELAYENKEICLFEADLMLASGTKIFKNALPDRFFNVGVAEANMIGIAAGLSTLGKIPFCTTFTPFATRRTYDQITVSVAYAKQNVKIVGTDPGITATTNGGTHMCFQDLAIMRAMPRMTVLSPADAYELKQLLHFMVNFTGPVYMQLIRGIQPQILNPDYRFELAKAVKLASGSDVTIVSTGYTTAVAVQAVKALRSQGIYVDHLHYPTVKPFDKQAIIDSARKTNFVVTVENQNIIGGLGSAVCESLAEKHPAIVHRLGVPDEFGEVADENFLMEKHQFRVTDIVNAVCNHKTNQKN